MKLRTDEALNRSTLLWLLFAQALVIIPHLGHLPLWTMMLWLVCAGLRIQIYLMRARFPNRMERTALIAFTGMGVYLSRDTLVGLDAAALLLVATFIIKLLELRSRRDAQVLILLGFFVLVIAWLFNDDLVFAVYGLLPLLALLSALCSLQHPRFLQYPWQPLRLCSLMLLQALPLMVLLFVFFPRFTPLWSLPLQSNKGINGLSDSMDVSDITELALSDELVFRVGFADGHPPPQALLYWRALTLDRFDGKRWSQSRWVAYAKQQTPPWQQQGMRIDYQLTLQPSWRTWLPMLEIGQIHLPQSRQTPDFRVESLYPVERPLHYLGSSWPFAQRKAASTRGLEIASQLPQSGNPRSRKLAQTLRKEHQDNEEALVKTLLAGFKNAPYRYTLTPDALGEDSIDSFLFDTQNGFCAHYAGATVFVLRAAGIPARIVTGYQGGEWNEGAGFLQVHQYDAHAWVEYWHKQKGWQRIDPTYEVAPERIEQGMEAALSSRAIPSSHPLSQRYYRNIAWLNRMRLLMDDVQYNWQLWVLNYQNEQRLQLLEKLDRQTLLWMAAAFALFLTLLCLYLFRPRQTRKNAALREFDRFERLLATQGLQRKAGEAPRHFAVRASAALPAQAALIQAFIERFEAQQYAGLPPDRNALQRAVKKLRRALPGRRFPITVQSIRVFNRN